MIIDLRSYESDRKYEYDNFNIKENKLIIDSNYSNLIKNYYSA